MKVKKINIVAFLIISSIGLFAYLKFNLNYYTPDEIFYTNPGIYPDDVSFKFLVTKIILTYIHSFNQYLLPFLNILIAILVLRFFYHNFLKKNKILPFYFILIIFLFPSVIYISSAYLRDFYIYIFSLAFFYSEKLKTRTALVLILLIGILRYEAGIIIILSILIERIIFNAGTIKFNRVALVISIVFMWMIVLMLSQNDFLFNQFYDLVNRYEKSTTGFSIFQLPITKESVLIYSLPNWAAYWMPFFFKRLGTLFDYFLLIDALAVFFLIIRFYSKYRAKNFKKDKMYRIATFVFLTTFFIALPESVPETMIRHHLAYLPALLYLNYPVK